MTTRADIPTMTVVHGPGRLLVSTIATAMGGLCVGSWAMTFTSPAYLGWLILAISTSVFTLALGYATWSVFAWSVRLIRHPAGTMLRVRVSPFRMTQFPLDDEARIQFVMLDSPNRPMWRATVSRRDMSVTLEAHDIDLESLLAVLAPYRELAVDDFSALALAQVGEHPTETPFDLSSAA